MRAVLLVLIILVVAAIVAFATGLIGVTQTQQAALPSLSRDGTTLSATGGQPPKFDVQTGSVGVGTGQANVSVPELKIERGQQKVSVPTLQGSRPAPPPASQPAH